MSEDYFSGIKVGDRVWSLQHGWMKVVDLDTYSISGISTIGVKKENSVNRISYYKDGKFYHADTFQSLFWDEVKIVPPPKPKKIVKKEVYGFVILDAIENDNEIIFCKKKTALTYIHPVKIVYEKEE